MTAEDFDDGAIGQDGAMTSGIREGKRLLGRPGVRLGPIRTASM